MLLYSAREQQLRNCIPVGIHLNLIKGRWPRINQTQCSNIESILAVMNTTELVVEIKTEKKIQARTGFEPMTSAILVQRST